MLKLLATVITGVAALSATAFGQAEVTATTKTAQTPAIENAYLRADVRHYTKQTFNDKGEVTSTSPSLQPRLELGTLLLDKKLDMFYSMRFEKTPQNGRNSQAETVKMIQPFIWAEYHLMENDLGVAGPYAEIYPKFGDAADNGYFGAYYYAPGTDINIGIGSLNLYGEAYANYAYDHSNNRRDVELKNKNLSLAPNQTTTTERNPAYNLSSLLLAEIKIAAVKGLSTGVDTAWSATYEPKYSVIGDDADRSELDGYSTTAETQSSGFVKYKFTDNLSLANNLYVNHDGFFQSYKDQRLMNRLRLVYNFF
ncbi:MAG: hypothetical protein AB7T49_12170 [Oligoflexales bacterium]